MVKYKCVLCKKTRYFTRIGTCAIKHATKYHSSEMHFKKIDNNQNKGLKKYGV